MSESARLRAQRRQVEVNGREWLPLSVRFTFDQPAEAMAVREELKQVRAERLRMIAENGESKRLGIKPAYSPEALREILARSNRLRVKLNELTL